MLSKKDRAYLKLSLRNVNPFAIRKQTKFDWQNLIESWQGENEEIAQALYDITELSDRGRNPTMEILDLLDMIE